MSSTLKRGASGLSLAISYGTRKLASLKARSWLRSEALLAFSKLADRTVSTSSRVFGSAVKYQVLGGTGTGKEVWPTGARSWG